MKGFHAIQETLSPHKRNSQSMLAPAAVTGGH